MTVHLTAGRCSSSKPLKGPACETYYITLLLFIHYTTTRRSDNETSCQTSRSASPLQIGVCVCVCVCVCVFVCRKMTVLGKYLRSRRLNDSPNKQIAGQIYHLHVTMLCPFKKKTKKKSPQHFFAAGIQPLALLFFLFLSPPHLLYPFHSTFIFTNPETPLFSFQVILKTNLCNVKLYDADAVCERKMKCSKR